MNPPSAQEPNKSRAAARLPRFECSYKNCSRAYYRKEHLARHVRSQHTRLSPYACHVCQRRFSRTDVLKRHIDHHMKNASSSGRAVSACDRCHARKSKCDGDMPCSGCIDSRSKCARARTSLELLADNITVMASNRADPEPEAEQNLIETRSGLDINNQFGISGSTAADVARNSPTTTNEACLSLIAAEVHPDGMQPSTYTQGSFSATASSGLRDGYDLPQSDAPTEIQTEPQSYENWKSPWMDLPDFHDLDFQTLAFSPLDTTTQCIPVSISESWQPRSSVDTVGQTGLLNFRNSAMLPVETSSCGQPFEPQWWGLLPSNGMTACTGTIPLGSLDDYQDEVLVETHASQAHTGPSETIQHLEVHADHPVALQWSPSKGLTPENHYIELYFSCFHPQWPILHRTSFERETATELIHSVLMIGAWLSDSESAKAQATSLHSSMTDTLRIHIMQPLRPRSPCDSWPVSLYQAVLLHIIFGMYCVGDRFSQACILNSLLISNFREIGLFRSECIKAQDSVTEATDLRWIRLESLKRLAFAAFKADCYISVIQDQPPVIRYQELRLPLHCTEEIWESNTLPARAEERGKQLEVRRSKDFCNIVREALMESPRPPLPPLLEGDYQLGMCAMRAKLWEEVYEEHSSSQQVLTASEALAIQCRNLERWHQQLEYWKSSVKRDETIGARYSSPEKRRSIFFNSMMMYHLSHLGLHADLLGLKRLATVPQNGNYSPVIWRDMERRFYAWAQSKGSRIALWHTSQLYRCFYQASRRQMNVSSGGRGAVAPDPVAFEALLKGGLVAWAYCRANRTCTLCASYSNQSSRDEDSVVDGNGPLNLTDDIDSVALQSWIENGGRACIGGTLVCACNLSELVGRFEALLLEGGGTWLVAKEMSTFIGTLKGRC